MSEALGPIEFQTLITAVEMNSELSRSIASIDSREAKRHAFILRLKPGMEKSYDEAHQKVPPDLITLLKRTGISDYSIFRRDRLLFLTLRVADFEQAWQIIERDPAFLAWQDRTAPFFDSADDLAPGERFQMMEEVFYLQ